MIHGGGGKIGSQCSFRENICINVTGGRVEIGNGCFFNDFVCLNSRNLIAIGSGSIFGQGVKIYDHDHDYKSENVHDNFVCSSVKIGNCVWVGSDAIILKGSLIGNNCVIGAKALLKRKLEDDTLYYNKIVPNIERIEINEEKTTKKDDS